MCSAQLSWLSSYRFLCCFVVACTVPCPTWALKELAKVDPEDVNVKTECPLANALDSLDEACQGELCFRGRNIMMGA